ncbi:hypothetical protein MTP99_004492 [Tenebrio molitor]|jgi:hypothetical protein|nr:hypothetical protein MTP99_004492 [Tenebrio molitor]
MGPDPFPKKQKNPSAKPKDKYQTEYYLREKRSRENYYNTAPNENKSNKETSHPSRAQHDYLRNNLHIKSCVCGNREILRCQTKKISFRNYTPKILNQEINMGMWM